MPSKTVVLCAVALTPDLVGEHTPRLRAFAVGGAMVPVGNGWLFRDTMEVRLWQQSNRLVQAPKVWEKTRSRPPISCANLSWWFAMYSSAAVTVTPRPMYPADGRKIADCYTKPGELRDKLQSELGRFPLFKFWGPAELVATRFSPDLSLVYLPHLDYGLQKKAPSCRTSPVS